MRAEGATMDEFVDKMAEKVGIDKDTAKKDEQADPVAETTSATEA